MQKVRFKEYPSEALRYHYWTVADHDPRGQHYDFRAQPELIPDVLEDFVPFGSQPGVQRFYSFLASVNGESSFLETDDCAFRGPQRKPPGSLRLFFCTGRVILLYRSIEANLDRELIELLGARIGYHLQVSTPELPDAASQVAIVPTSYSPHTGHGDQPIGAAIELTFWAEGDNETETFEALDSFVAALSIALDAVNAEIRQTIGGRPTEE